MTEQEIIEKFNNSELGRNLRFEQFTCSEEKLNIIKEKYGEKIVNLIKQLKEMNSIYKLNNPDIFPKYFLDYLKDLNEFKFEDIEEIKENLKGMIFGKEILEVDETIQLLKDLNVEILRVGNIDELKCILPLAEQLKKLEIRIWRKNW